MKVKIHNASLEFQKVDNYISNGLASCVGTINRSSYITSVINIDYSKEIIQEANNRDNRTFLKVHIDNFDNSQIDNVDNIQYNIEKSIKCAFFDNFHYQTNIYINSIIRGDFNYSVLAINTTAMAIKMALLPFNGYIAAVNLAYIDNQWIAFPDNNLLIKSPYSILISGLFNGNNIFITLLDVHINYIFNKVGLINEDILLDGINIGTQLIREICQKEDQYLSSYHYKQQRVYSINTYQDNSILYNAINNKVSNRLKVVISSSNNEEEDYKINLLKNETVKYLSDQFDVNTLQRVINHYFMNIIEEIIYHGFKINLRSDKRQLSEIRNIDIRSIGIHNYYKDILLELGNTKVLNKINYIDNISAIYTNIITDHKYIYSDYINSNNKQLYDSNKVIYSAFIQDIAYYYNIDKYCNIITNILSSDGSIDMSLINAIIVNFVQNNPKINNNQLIAVSLGVFNNDIKENEPYIISDLNSYEYLYASANITILGTKNNIVGLHLVAIDEIISFDTIKSILKQYRQNRNNIENRLNKCIVSTNYYDLFFL